MDEIRKFSTCDFVMMQTCSAVVKMKIAVEQSPVPVPVYGAGPAPSSCNHGDYAGSDDLHTGNHHVSLRGSETSEPFRASGTSRRNSKIQDEQQRRTHHSPRAPHSAALSHCSHHQQYERWPPHKPPCPITNPTQASRPPSPLWTRPNKGQQATAFLSRLHFAFNHAFSSHPHNQLTLAFSTTVVFPRFLH